MNCKNCFWIFTFCFVLLYGSFAQNADLFGSSKVSNSTDSLSTLSIDASKELLKNKTSQDGELVPSAQLAMSSSDYLVTAGDVYTLAFAVGGTPVTYAISVDTTYRIRVANLAVLDVAGKTFVQTKQAVEEIVTKNYPMSGVQFVLLTPAVFKVTVNGEVTKTSVLQSWGLTRLSSVLEDLLTVYSSTRNVTVTSANGKKRSYDLFRASRFGELSQDPYLRPGDTVTVNRADRKIKISGAVERPGEYELLSDENLSRLVTYYAGGLTEFADISRVELTRLLGTDSLSGEKIYLDKDSFSADYGLYAHDSVYIPTYTELKPVVFFEGAVYSNETSSATLSASPQTRIVPEASTRIAVTFNVGENYASLIRRNKKMFSEVSDTENSYIIRRNGTMIPINIDRILYDVSFYSKESVEQYDTLMIPFCQYFVSVAGAVKVPGRYPYIPNRDWSYYIGLAGGFDENRNTNSIITIKDRYGNVLQKTDLITPESTITAKTNSFTYYFNQYSPVITTILSLITTALTVYSVTK